MRIDPFGLRVMLLRELKSINFFTHTITNAHSKGENPTLAHYLKRTDIGRRPR